jgi:hypothetical protein
MALHLDKSRLGVGELVIRAIAIAIADIINFQDY